MSIRDHRFRACQTTKRCPHCKHVFNLAQYHFHRATVRMIDGKNLCAWCKGHPGYKQAMSNKNFRAPKFLATLGLPKGKDGITGKDRRFN